MIEELYAEPIIAAIDIAIC